MNITPNDIETVKQLSEIAKNIVDATIGLCLLYQLSR